MFPVYISKKMTAWLLIFMQLITPVAGMAPLMGHAAVPSGTQGTVQGLNALIMGEAGGDPSPTPSGPAGVNEPVATPYYTPPASLPETSSKTGHGTSSVLDAAGLPDLSISVDEKAGAGAKPHDAEPVRDNGVSGSLASGAMQAGGLLSSDNATDASINYAKGVGEGLINQQINDWLKQFGNAKVSLGSDKKVSGDMLIPLYDAERDLLFTQVGIRTGQERNTANLGLGYRQYLSDWMLGVNTFYDYDYTGQNKRLGVGAEAWRDYLKLAVNGYYRLTDWHQSVLSAMEDYDERPANGFDLRAEGYLPAWPNLGGMLKYEQYFGKGVSLSNSTSVDSLKDNPKALTAGVTYTPFPLMTVSAAHSVGDTNDTRVGLDLTYRLGVPWYRQVSPDSVDLMRSLAGSKYDFVDRNYEIVMQYRKQELLTISLPAATTAQAAETIPVVLTVSKAKYGLKSVSWNVDPLLTARGGRYQQVSPTELRVTLPAYIFGQKTNVAQNYKISVVATDNHDNLSNTAEMQIGVVPSENTVSSLAISPNDKILSVDASKGYTITGVVTDGKGVPLANQPVTFSVDGLADAAGNSGATLSSTSDGKSTDSSKITVTTLADGKATVLLRSTVAGQATVTATMDNGNSSSGKVSFVADATTAAVTALVAEDDNATADGKAANSVVIFVKDKFGNPVNGAEVYLTASNGARIADKVSTNEQGSATVTLTNTKAGPSTVAASLNTSQKEVTVTFGVGKPALDASGIKTDKSDYTAGDDITVSAVLKDEQHNAITGRQALLTDSAVSVPNASAKSGSKWVEEAQTPGTYTRIYVAKTASENQTATLNLTGWSQASNAYSIIANMNKAAVMSIEAKDNNAVADGSAQNSVLVTVQDNYENRVSGAVVSLEASNGALIAGSATTGQDGTVLAPLTNTRAGVSKVTASLNSSSQSVNVGFGVGQPVRANSSIATDKTTYISGSDIQVEIKLADQKQNAVAGLNSAKLNSMVTVPNAQAKSTTNWVESSTAGSYIGTYVAKVSGENLTSTLRISDGDATSGAYAITAGEAVLANSAITRDSDSYVSGKDMTVTVTLKDGNGTPNPVTGLSSATLAGMVTVANAEAKPASSWTEVADKPGTYIGNYVANTAGTGLKATLSIAGSSKTSEAYAITAGSPVQATSSVAVDNTTYTAGDDITVTAVLKDGQGNAVAGQAAALTSGTTTLGNATLKSGSAWSESGTKGTYTVVYTAKTVSAGNTASVQLSGWSAAAESAAYGITVGGPVQATSSVAVDNTTYTAGDDMMVTVTLKDANNNPVTGKRLELTSTSVTVPNATLKSSGWTDIGGGSYTALHTAKTAGSNLKATLKLSGWSTAAESAAYAITVGGPVQATSSVAVDNTTYTAGDDITVTAVLKDGQGNAVAGQAAALTSGTTTLGNATLKSGSAWSESGTKGTYTVVYTAKTVSAGNTASVQLSGWSAAAESAAYAITVGGPVQATSSVAVDNTTYTAGDDITVTAVLKDGQGNAVAGQAAALTSGTTTLGNATLKSGSAWSESGTKGTYTVVYTAKTVSAGNTASVQLSGWSAAAESAAYGITVGGPVQATSSVAVDNTTYTAGDDMMVTVTLKDANNNPVTGKRLELTSTSVTVPNATLKSSGWTDIGGGSYTALHTAKTAGSNLKATLKLSGWSAAAESAAYAITVGGPVQATSSVAVDNTTYTAGDDITVTAVLKDGQGNAVAGQAAALTSGTTTLGNATLKSGSAWSESGTKGTYTVVYTAKTVSAGNTASVQLSGWSAAAESAAYAITVGGPVQATSSVAVDNTTYTAGDDITVTAVLKDGQGNAVAGQAAALTSGTTTLGNATLKSGSAWSESGTKGTYTVVYTAKTVSAGNTASVQLSGWSAAAESAAYGITVGGPVQATSKVETDAASYVAGAEMALKVTLKDGQGNGVSGQKASLTDAAVTVANATAKAAGVWADNGDGTYSRTYIANTVGSSLKATLQLSGWSAASASAAYAITPGDAVQATSLVAVDNTTYTAGADMMVTVTLKDANNNPVTGKRLELTSTSVTVPNATLKSSGWTDIGGGSYTALHTAKTAGSNLKATLQLSGWSTASASAAYAITPGDAVQATSLVAVDNTTYTAGADMMVTVTLKDANNNPVTGKRLELTSTSVTVPNATLKSSGWTDIGGGSYTALHTAKTAGSNLKATLQLSGWSTASASAAYGITVGGPVQATSKVETDAASYVAGAEMALKVTLKDGQGNGVSGQKASLTDAAVTVANATAKAAGVWADNGDGTYSRTYIANTVGSSLKATLQLSGWSAASASAAYAITPGDAVQATSSVAVDNTTYTAGADMMVTVTLKDANNNPVTGKRLELTSTSVTVPNATLKSSGWTDIGGGSYTALHTAKTAGSNLKATLQLSGWSAASASAAYAITPGDAVQATSLVAVDNTTYTAGADMMVTVTLKDANNNPVTGKRLELTSTSVTVPNATLKSSGWTDIGGGSYTALHTAKTAGSNLKATLQLSGWSTASASAAYAITPGDAVQATSLVAVDNTTYTAGADMMVTVTLKDANNNPVTGKRLELTSTSVTVPNATLKNSGWTDIGGGSYTALHTAKTAGSNLKATLQLSGWSTASASAAYGITVGGPVQATSKVETDAASYVAGAEMALKVTLKDGQGNGVSGQKASLTDAAVTVANATAKAAGVWADNGDGTYSRTYIANTVGSSLKATLQLSGWSAASASAAYAITPGDAVQATSSVAVDNTTYTAGADMMVTVTLKDANNNPVTGKRLELTSTSVTVPNATLKSSGWTDIGGGSYTALHTAKTAGSNLKATLQLSGWSAASASAAYAITPGDAVQATSLVAVDNTTYTAGADMMVTVTLKDANNNPVTGKRLELTSTSVTVPNATLKSSGWTDIGGGSYTALHTAKTAGSNLKATLQLSGWSTASASAAYAITPGDAVQATSLVAVDNTTYTAGADMMVTVTLKDANNNPVTGKRLELTSTSVTVPNATLKNSGWTDIGGGSYTALHTAKTAGSNLKATLQLSGWSTASASAAYGITPGDAVQATSSVAVDNTTYYVDEEDMMVTVTLKDANNNPVTGKRLELTSTSVTVPNATLKSSGWTDIGGGSYTALHTAKTAGSNLKATLQLSGWSTASASAAYTIKKRNSVTMELTYNTSDLYKTGFPLRNIGLFIGLSTKPVTGYEYSVSPAESCVKTEWTWELASGAKGNGGNGFGTKNFSKDGMVLQYSGEKVTVKVKLTSYCDVPYTMYLMSANAFWGAFSDAAYANSEQFEL